jgi:Methyltransferase FkbM domain
MPGAATGDPEIFEHIVRLGGRLKQFSVAMTSLDADVRRLKLPLPNFIKIDTKGMELNALEGMSPILKSKHPDLYLELHGTTPEDKRANAAAVIRFSRSVGTRFTRYKKDEPLHARNLPVEKVISTAVI